jgi:hypothetical protein
VFLAAVVSGGRDEDELRILFAGDGEGRLVDGGNPLPVDDSSIEGTGVNPAPSPKNTIARSGR